jgi:ceramide glucosyltransferase
LTLFLLIAGFVALAYQVIALLASVVHASRASRPAAYLRGVSILKPVYGLDDRFLEAIRTHAAQDYPEYEVLFGVHDLSDAAVPAIRQLITEYPECRIRIIETGEGPPNAKAGSLIRLAREARYPVLLVNDSDISVPRDYLQRVVAPLDMPDVGLVTCLYRATAGSLAGKWEALGIATDFIPSTLVAPMVGVREFGLGSTLCFRAQDLERIGGFASIVDYIADDYQLTRRICALGKRAHLSEVVVATHLGNPSWGAVWRHQVRWARTIRVSRLDGYIGLPVTHAGLWALLCVTSGLEWLALLLVLIRIANGAAAGIGILRQPGLWKALVLTPVWDLWAFAVWLAGLSGGTVEWRGRTFRLARDGRMHSI